MKTKYIKPAILISFIILFIFFSIQSISAQKVDNTQFKNIQERLETIEKNNNGQAEHLKHALSVSGDTVKYVGIIASLVLPLIILLIGYQVIRSSQFEREIRETRKLMMDEYQKMLDISAESEKLKTEITGKLTNLARVVKELATEHLQKAIPNLFAEVKEQTNQAIAEIKTKDEEMKKSIELIKKIETLDLTLTPSLYIERGKLYLGQGNNEKAIENFNEAIKLGSDNFEVYFNRGLAYHRANKFDAAIKDYEKAIKINPKDYSTHANMGTCYRVKKEHDYEKSLQYLTDAIKLDPKHDHAYFQRGITYEKMTKYDLAINDFKQIENSNQNLPYLLGALYFIGVCYGAMGNFDSAIEYYLARFNKEKDVFTALNLAEAYICKKAFSDAEEWANKSYPLSDTDREKILSKFLLITALILNNKEYQLELNAVIYKIKASPTFEIGEWSFGELSGCLTDKSIPIEKAELIKKLIALLKKEIKPEDFIIPS